MDFFSTRSAAVWACEVQCWSWTPAGRGGPDAGQLPFGADHDLELVPILNKIDLPSADPTLLPKRSRMSSARSRMEAPARPSWVSASSGRAGMRRCDILAPRATPTAPLKALIFDSIYDSYKGVIVYVRIFEGTVRPGDTIRLMSTGAQFSLSSVGHMGDRLTPPRTSWRPVRSVISPPASRRCATPRRRYCHVGGQPHAGAAARLSAP